MTREGKGREADESDNDEYDSYAIDCREQDDLSDVILAFINSDEEDDNDRPNATRSGRAICFCNKFLSVVY